MSPRRASFFRLLPVATGLLALAGCSLPQAQPDPTRFYLLSTATTTRAAATAEAPVVHLRQVELASYLRSRPLIIRRGNNEIEFREFAHWGEPLELGIARVLREELLARGAASAVVTSGVRREAGGRDVTLLVRVLSCEGATNGEVAFRAVWELSESGGNPHVIASGHYHPLDLRWDGKNEGSLAAQLSQAVVGLAAEVAGGLAKK